MRLRNYQNFEQIATRRNGVWRLKIRPFPNLVGCWYKIYFKTSFNRFKILSEKRALRPQSRFARGSKNAGLCKGGGAWYWSQSSSLAWQTWACTICSEQNCHKGKLPNFATWWCGAMMDQLAQARRHRCNSSGIPSINRLTHLGHVICNLGRNRPSCTALDISSGGHCKQNSAYR